MNKDADLIIAPDEPSAGAVEVPVLEVFDGDGFLIRIKPTEFTDNLSDQSEIEVTARFGFVDAPELDQPGGPEAKTFLETLIGGRNVWIDILTKSDTGRSVDRYGRIVCVPYLVEGYSECVLVTSKSEQHRAHVFGKAMHISRNIELEMVLNGWAWVLERYGPDDRYLQALELARINKRGIWALKNNINPWVFKQQRGFASHRGGMRTKSAAYTRCPEEQCGGTLVKRSGKFGEFLGCSNYPKCTYSRSTTAQ